MKKTSLSLLVVVTALVSMTTGAYAASNSSQIKALLNGEIKFVKNGSNWEPKSDEGIPILPITYNGTTYLPLRVIANAFDIKVNFDPKAQVIKLDGSDKSDSSNTGNNTDSGKSNENPVNLYSGKIKVNLTSEKYMEVADKKQLVFGGKQYNGAYAFVAESMNTTVYNAGFDFGKKYNTLHLVLYTDSPMKIKVLNAKGEQISENISLEEDKVTELDIDLQGGSQYAKVYAFDAQNSVSKPYLYILKDTYVK